MLGTLLTFGLADHAQREPRRGRKSFSLAAASRRVMPVNAEQLRAKQAPLKTRYKEDPSSATVVLRARGRVSQGSITCALETGKAGKPAGLHPATGGDGTAACSGDMLLEALVSCAGVTLAAVATSMGIEFGDATVSAEGALDFRGTLGVAKETPVG